MPSEPSDTADHSALCIRRATRADADAVVALVGELCAHEGDPQGGFTPETFEATGCGDDPLIAVMIAERQGSVLGYVMCTPAFDSAYALRGLYVSDLFVRPEARRQGVGRALLAAAARLARDGGAGFIWLTSHLDNEAAHAFYRTLATVEETVVAFAIAGPDLDRLAAG